MVRSAGMAEARLQQRVDNLAGIRYIQHMTAPLRQKLIDQVMNAPSNGGNVGTTHDGEWALTVDTIKREVRGYAVRYEMAGDEVMSELGMIDITVSTSELATSQAVARAVDQIRALWR